MVYPLRFLNPPHFHVRYRAFPSYARSPCPAPTSIVLVASSMRPSTAASIIRRGALRHKNPEMTVLVSRSRFKRDAPWALCAPR